MVSYQKENVLSRWKCENVYLYLSVWRFTLVWAHTLSSSVWNSHVFKRTISKAQRLFSSKPQEPCLDRAPGQIDHPVVFGYRTNSSHQGSVRKSRGSPWWWATAGLPRSPPVANTARLHPGIPSTLHCEEWAAANSLGIWSWGNRIQQFAPCSRIHKWIGFAQSTSSVLGVICKAFFEPPWSIQIPVSPIRFITYIVPLCSHSMESTKQNWPVRRSQKTMVSRKCTSVCL